MVINNVQDILEKVIEAHGGSGRWRELAAVEAIISARGFLFTAKRRPILNRVRVRAFTREPRFIFYDFPRAGQTGELSGNNEVSITGPGNQVVSNRMQPRAAIQSLRRQLYWDDLDFLYFGGYATWNYLVTPFLFLRDGFEFEVLEPSSGIDCPFRLQVSFPDDLPTHCQKQIFYFDRDYLMRRLDYTAEVVGRWAHAAHLCENYRDFEGIKVPTTRRVRPLFIGNRPLPAPTIVAIDIHEFRPLS
ncbi:MAG: hypothetical protein JSW26_20645 [Desulfobacterales bacterium]|nr:MAG: hypothetical protein JSW26_20645 [Desulfobacterales bacterium]